jgi:hypothetical protein
MPSSQTEAGLSSREEAKARVRAKVAARHNMTARDYLASLLHATHTAGDAESILETFERQSATASRLNHVLDICDAAVRSGRDSVDVDRVHAAALGDDVRNPGGTR